MEEIKSFHESKEEGKKVWSALTSQMGEGAGFFGAMLSGWRRFFRKQLPGLLIFGLIFGAIGCFYAFTQKRTVEAEMTVSYAQLEKKIYADMLFKLEQLRSSGQVAALASALGITEDQAMQIHRIDSKNIHLEPLINDISTEKVPFYIVVEVYDESLLPGLQQALVKYINEPPFVKSRLKLNEQNYRNEIRLIQTQLLYLDSLKGYLLRNMKNPDSGTVAGLNNLNKSQNELFARIRDLEGALQFNQNIEVMDGFVGHHPPLLQKYIRFFLMGFAFGLVLRLVWIAFR